MAHARSMADMDAHSVQYFAPVRVSSPHSEQKEKAEPLRVMETFMVYLFQLALTSTR
jgi:hypothetical protein